MNIAYIQSISGVVLTLINQIIVPLLIALAFLMFLWGVVKMFFLGGEKDRETGRYFILYGIIGFVVIFSVWGLVNVLGSTFGLGAGGNAPVYPALH